MIQVAKKEVRCRSMPKMSFFVIQGFLSVHVRERCVAIPLYRSSLDLVGLHQITPNYTLSVLQKRYNLYSKALIILVTRVCCVASYTGSEERGSMPFDAENEFLRDSRIPVGTRKGVLCCHPIYSGRQLWTHQPGSHRRKDTRGFSTFLLRCLTSFLSREGFSRPFPSSTVKSSFVYPRNNRSPLVGIISFFFFVRKNPSSCDCTGIQTPVPTSEGFNMIN